MRDPFVSDHRSLDVLAAEIVSRGWVFEIITLGATYQPAPLSRMIANACIGRIMTPDGEVEWSAITPRVALAGALAEAIRIHGDR
jgi:hypothetical protein